MKFTIQDKSTLDPATLSDELIAVMGSNFGISTAGTEITAPVAAMTPAQITQFQAVLDAHVLAAATRPIKKAALETIERLERENMMPRATREFMLTYMELNATAAQLAANVGYQKVKALDNLLRAERAKLI